MSHFATVTTVFKDRECLIAALRETFAEVQYHANGEHLYGYSETRTANIIVRKATVAKVGGHAYGDMGFSLVDGAYQMTADDLDLARLGGKNWMGKLTQKYAIAKVRKEAHLQGRVVSSVKTNTKGEVVMVLEV